MQTLIQKVRQVDALKHPRTRNSTYVHIMSALNQTRGKQNTA